MSKNARTIMRRKTSPRVIPMAMGRMGTEEDLELDALVGGVVVAVATTALVKAEAEAEAEAEALMVVLLELRAGMSDSDSCMLAETTYVYTMRSKRKRLELRSMFVETTRVCCRSANDVLTYTGTL
jgi:hypothetical protein